MANELFSILELGGAQETPITEGRELKGTLISVHLNHFTPTAHFDAAILPGLEEGIRVIILHFFEKFLAQREINRTPIVRIDQTAIP